MADLKFVLGLARKSATCLADEKEIDRVETEIERIAAELEAAQEHIRATERWAEGGEQKMRASTMFKIGVWWGSRPRWRAARE